MENSKINIGAISPFIVLCDELIGEENLKEITLLLAWGFLIFVKGDKELPLMTSVLEGKQDLKSAYKNIATVLEKNSQFLYLGECYSESVLPDLVSHSEAKAIIERFYTLQRDETAYPHIINAIFDRIYGEWEIPSVLAELMFKLGGSAEKSIYSPNFPSWKVAYIQTINGGSATIETDKHTLFMLVFSLVHDIELIINDPILSPPIKNIGARRIQFPVVHIVQPYNQFLSSPPLYDLDRFQSITTNGVVLAIEHGLAHCSEKMIALVPQSFLFHRANNYELRVSLVDSGVLDLVIQLPGNIEGDTYTPLALIVIDKHRDKDCPVMFYDAVYQEEFEEGVYKEAKTRMDTAQVFKDVINHVSNDYSVFVGREEISKNGYDLSVRRYSHNTATKKLISLPNTKPLSEIATLIRAQPLKEDKTPAGDLFYIASPRDIGESGLLDVPEQHLLLTGSKRDRAKFQRLKEDDILISIKGNIGTIGIVGENCGANWVANQIFMIIRLNKNCGIKSSKYLFRYLKSPLVKAYFEGKVAGLTVQSLKGMDIKELLVPIPIAEDEDHVIGTNDDILSCYSQIDALKEEGAELNQKHWPIV